MPSSLPTTSKDPGITNEIVCGLIESMQIKSVRVWMHLPYVLQRAPTSNTLSFKRDIVEDYHAYFSALASAGVENILVMNHQYLYPVEAGPITYNGVIPDPDSQTREYVAFLELFRDCYAMLAEEFPEVDLWESNNEPDHPSGTTIAKNGFVQGGGSANTPYLYSLEEVARITADQCYYANLGIKSADPANELVMPGLVFGYDRDTYFIEMLYEQIESGALPTRTGEGRNGALRADIDPDHYFDVLNWHPYANVAPGDAWLQENIAMYRIAAAHGDGDKPLFLSEFGWSDEFDTSLQENIADWYPEAFDLLRENLPTLESVFCFRMFNWTTAGSGVKPREKSFGLFTSPAEIGGILPKPAAIALFRYFNGKDADISVLYRYRAA